MQSLAGQWPCINFDNLAAIQVAWSLRAAVFVIGKREKPQYPHKRKKAGTLRTPAFFYPGKKMPHHCQILKTGILRIVHELPADDDVVITTIFDDQVLIRPGHNSVVVRAWRQPAEPARITCELDIIGSVAGGIVIC